jgi:signal transduction histidine kinase
LNAIIGFSEGLLERMCGELNERQDDYLRDTWSSGKHLFELLNDILDLSKIEAGQMVLNRSAIGSVTNLAARLCAKAAPWQIVVAQRVNAAAENLVVSRPVGELSLRGFSRPIRIFEVSGLDSARVTS